MIFLYVAVFLVWLYFWVRGNVWAAASVPVVWVALLWLTYTDGGAKANTPQIYALAAVMSAIAFVPYAIHRYRERRIARTLHGITFLSRVD